MKSYVFLVLCCFCLTSPAAASTEEDKGQLSDEYDFELTGFLEAGIGRRIQDDPYEKEASLAETLLLLDLAKDFNWGAFKAKGFVRADGITDEVTTVLRDCNLFFSPLSNMDIKAGRQVITWGTGDMVFINDFFAKDWESFFIGRDDEFLKASTDGVRTSLFFDAVNIDAVFVPIATASNHITGERLSYWNSVQGQIAGQNYLYAVDDRSSFGNDSEYAARLYRTWGSSLEVALYGYSGFWKTPEGLNPVDMSIFYPRLSVYGGSVRGPLFGGIGHLETGYYDSRADRDGSRPFIRNSELRVVSGLEKEVGHEFTAGVQYYLEWMMDYEDYERSAPQGMPVQDEYRHVLTVRLTKLLFNQNLILSFFSYYSPSDKDGYLRPKAQYKLTDQWLLETGGNIFLGTDDHTFFGQFEDNSNIYARIRWRF